MKVIEIINKADGAVSNNLNIDEKIDVINKVEEEVYGMISDKFSETDIDLVAGQNNYALADIGCSFDDINKLTISGKEYKKMKMNEYLSYSFYESGTDIIIDPTPAAALTAGMNIVHRKQITEKTTANKEDADLDIVKDYGKRFDDLYYYMLLHKYCVRNQEFELANNYANLYNDVEAKLFEYIYKHEPVTTSIVRKRANNWR